MPTPRLSGRARAMAPLAAGSLILLAATVAHAQSPRELSDQELAHSVMHPGSLQLQHHGDVLGLLHGATVRLDRGMSDVGPSWEILWLEPPAGESCADVGGVMRSRVVSRGWIYRSKMYCTPKVVADAQDLELQAAQRRAPAFPRLNEPQTTPQPPGKSSAGQATPP